MKYLKFTQIKFSEVKPNDPFYLINPDDNKNAQVHFSSDPFPFDPDTIVWVIDE